MGFWSAVRTCLGKYVVFRGRASRSEYWFFILFFVLASMAIGIVDSAVFPAFTTVEDGGPLGGVFGLAMLLPLVAAGWRRMHDSGRSGLFLFYPLIAWVGLTTYLGLIGGLGALRNGDLQMLATGIGGVIGLLALIVVVISPFIVIFWLCRPSQKGDNRYGPNPFS